VCGHLKFEPCICVKPTLPSMLSWGVIWTPTPAVAVKAVASLPAVKFVRPGSPAGPVLKLVTPKLAVV
jgi:hypothetical protein